jgi:hypothetical protein
MQKSGNPKQEPLPCPRLGARDGAAPVGKIREKFSVRVLASALGRLRWLLVAEMVLRTGKIKPATCSAKQSQVQPGSEDRPVKAAMTSFSIRASSPL